MITSNVSHRIRSRAGNIFNVLCAAGGMALAGIAAAGVPSDAAMAEGAPSLSIKFDPASLSSEEGAREVYRRLQRAAERVCPDVSTGTRLVSVATLECRRQAVARAVAAINDPRLAAFDAVRAKQG